MPNLPNRYRSPSQVAWCTESVDSDAADVPGLERYRGDATEADITRFLRADIFAAPAPPAWTDTYLRGPFPLVAWHQPARQSPFTCCGLRRTHPQPGVGAPA
jgi:hypothetical protein